MTVVIFPGKPERFYEKSRRFPEATNPGATLMDSPDRSASQPPIQPPTQSPERPGIRHRAYWAFFLLTLLAIAGFVRHHIIGLDIHVRREGLSNVAVVACQRVLVDHDDIETGLRGYLVVGQREYLRPYYEGLGRAQSGLFVLQDAVGPAGGEEITHFWNVANHSRAMLKEFANQVEMVDSANLDAARERFASFPTKPSMDQIRFSLLSIEAAEKRRLAENTAQLERSLATTIVLVNTFMGIVVILLGTMATGFISPPGSRQSAGGRSSA